MKLNLGPEIDREIARIIEKFVEAGWTQKDTGFATRNAGGLEMDVVVAPKLLWYRADEKIDQAVVWHGLRFSWKCPVEAIREVQAPAMRDWLQSVGLTPFKDEDVRGLLTCFRERPDDDFGEWHSYECWVNPDYPDGKWANHAL